MGDRVAKKDRDSQPSENNKAVHLATCLAKAASIAALVSVVRVPHVGALDEPTPAVPGKTI